MRARLLIGLIGGLTIFANLWFSVSPALAVAAGIAVVLVGEGVGRLSRAAVLAPVAVSGSQPLSRREVEVAVLIAQGLTSKEVGRRLFIERGTVDTHVQHIYNKLNIDSRPQLAIWLMEHGLHEHPTPGSNSPTHK